LAKDVGVKHFNDFDGPFRWYLITYAEQTEKGSL
jgi:hypothetical protein